MELHQLEYVLALEKYMNFSVAAEEVSISQPTLSHQIKKLEDELGVSLFIRTTRSIQLTPAGEEFITYAKRILAEVENAQNAMLEHTNLEKGSIKIGAIPNMAHLGITSVIATFQKMYPGIHMELFEDNSDNLLKKMYTFEIDVAFLTTPYFSESELAFFPLIDDELVLIVPRTHPLAGLKTAHIAQFAREKFLMIKSSTGLNNTLLKACRDAGFEPDIILNSGHTETIKGLIEEGVGVAFFSSRVAAAIKSSKIAIIKLSKSIRRVTGLAVSERSNTLSTKAFRDFVLQQTF